MSYSIKMEYEKKPKEKVRFQTRFGLREGMVIEEKQTYPGIWLKVEESTGKTWWIRRESVLNK